MFLAFIALASCQIEYDAETRLITETRIVDSDGNPISGKKISILIRDGNSSNTISHGITDNDGNTLLIFPAPENTDARIGIAIEGGNEMYQNKAFLNILRSDFEDYKFALQDVVLFKEEELTLLQVTSNQVSSSAELTSFIVIGLGTSSVYWNPNVEYYDYQQSYPVRKNQVVDVVYTLIDHASNPPVSTTYTVPVTIGNDASNYIINY
jgi:hypothetical protein